MANISIKIVSVPKFPGDREDNLWLCYDADKVPKTEAEWKEKNFVHKTHFGYYSWPSEMKVCTVIVIFLSFPQVLKSTI